MAVLLRSQLNNLDFLSDKAISDKSMYFQPGPDSEDSVGSHSLHAYGSLVLEENPGDERLEADLQVGGHLPEGKEFLVYAI